MLFICETGFASRRGTEGSSVIWFSEGARKVLESFVLSMSGVARAWSFGTRALGVEESLEGSTDIGVAVRF